MRLVATTLTIMLCAHAHAVEGIADDILALTGDKRVKIVWGHDTTAAGDAFCAATAVASLESNDPAEVLSFGATAGALACTRVGAIPALPQRAQVEALRAASRVGD